MQTDDKNLLSTFNQESAAQSARRAGLDIDPKKPLTLGQAIRLFDYLADLPDIPCWHTNADAGCYARAHIMCRKMIKDLGLDPKKAWAHNEKECFFVELPQGRTFDMYYHVAPALSVVMPDGSELPLVFDPGFFDGPVTLKEWGRAMSLGEEHLQIAPHDQQVYGSAPKDPDAYAAAIMQKHLFFRSSEKRQLLASSLRQPTFPCEGDTWRTAPKI